jgi:LmbE family N-acetylglucosaminyl deacetylase
MNETVFILAPHTDDGELGCGATMAKLVAQGKNVFYIAFSTCSSSLPTHLPTDTLKNECTNAVQTLAIPTQNLIFFDFEVRRLLFHRQEILEELIKLNKQYEPATVLLPAQHDIHQDHQAIYAEGMRAFRNANLLGYELPWNNYRFQPNYFEKISEENLQLKIKALAQYKSQGNRKYMNEHFIRSLATVRGMQANADYAEAFEAYRLIN